MLGLEDGVCMDDTNGSGGEFTGKFYVDYVHMKCAQDCDPATFSPPCQGHPPDSSGYPATLYGEKQLHCYNC